MRSTVEGDHGALLLALDRNRGLDFGDDLFERGDEEIGVGAARRKE